MQHADDNNNNNNLQGAANDEPWRHTAVRVSDNDDDVDASRSRDMLGGSVTREYTGGTYMGEWRASAPHGWGRMVYARGDVYDGEWCNGLRHGTGRLVEPDGFSYEGGWQGDRPHGRGVECQPHGMRFEGSFVAGLRHGSGVELPDTLDDAPGDGVTKAVWEHGSARAGALTAWTNGDVQLWSARRYRVAWTDQSSWMPGSRSRASVERSTRGFIFSPRCADPLFAGRHIDSVEWYDWCVRDRASGMWINVFWPRDGTHPDAALFASYVVWGHIGWPADAARQAYVFAGACLAARALDVLADISLEAPADYTDSAPNTAKLTRARLAPRALSLPRLSDSAGALDICPAEKCTMDAASPVPLPLDGEGRYKASTIVSRKVEPSETPRLQRVVEECDFERACIVSFYETLIAEADADVPISASKDAANAWIAYDSHDNNDAHNDDGA